MDLRERHADQPDAAHGALAVVGDVLLGGQVVLGHAGAVAGHHDAVADLDLAQRDRLEQRLAARAGVSADVDRMSAAHRPRRPGKTLPDQPLRRGDLQLGGHVAGAGVEDAALAPGPHERRPASDASDPRPVLAAEGRLGQHVHAGIEVHVVLLGGDLEVGYALRRGVLAVDDLDRVGHRDALAPGMIQERRAGEQRELQARAKRGRHAMPAGQPGPRQHRLVQPALGPLGEILGGGVLRPADDDQVIAGQVALEETRILGLLDFEAEV